MAKAASWRRPNWWPRAEQRTAGQIARRSCGRKRRAVHGPGREPERIGAGHRVHNQPRRPHPGQDRARSRAASAAACTETCRATSSSLCSKAAWATSRTSPAAGGGGAFGSPPRAFPPASRLHPLRVAPASACVAQLPVPTSCGSHACTRSRSRHTACALRTPERASSENALPGARAASRTLVASEPARPRAGAGGACASCEHAPWKAYPGGIVLRRRRPPLFFPFFRMDRMHF